jgi:predicted HicB family RNase H-like nuclease
MLNEETERERFGPDRRPIEDRRATIVDRRRRGRPPLVNGEQPSELTIRLPGELHDWLAQQAARQEVGVGTFARALLVAARALISVSE